MEAFLQLLARMDVAVEPERAQAFAVGREQFHARALDPAVGAVLVPKAEVLGEAVHPLADGLALGQPAGVAILGMEQVEERLVGVGQLVGPVAEDVLETGRIIRRARREIDIVEPERAAGHQVRQPLLELREPGFDLRELALGLRVISPRCARA